ncbi:MAG: MFS transporter [Pirellulales bacterium]|nr:MFS transporter [Pirellulales bacterium]
MTESTSSAATDHSSHGPDDTAARPTLTRYLVLAALCGFAIIAYVQRNSIGVAESTIRAELGLSKEQMGRVMSAFFLTYAIFQLPTGWLAHHWGTRRTLPLLAVVWSLATGMIGWGHGFVGLLAARSLMGAAQAGVFPCATTSVAVWLPLNRRGLASGSLSAAMSVGGALGVALAGWLVVDVGWRETYYLFCLPGLLFSLWFYFWFRDAPADHPRVNAAERRLLMPETNVELASSAAAPTRKEPIPWLALLTSPAMWAINGQQFFRAAGYIFFASWFATYLQESRGISIAQSGWLTSLPLIAVVVGSVLGGSLSDWLLVRTGSLRMARQWLSTVSVFVCAAFILAAYPVDNALLAVLLISAGSFCAAAAGPCSYSLTIDMGGRHVAAVFSTMNMSGSLGALVLPLVVPLVVDWSGGWHLVLPLFAGLYLAAGLCWLLLNPTGTVFDRSWLRGKASSA